ncbi:MAG: septum formation initiator family protein [Coriobacteriia bacterium]|nr:septum formation initiator family protein [Coriobacteriia bacterium]
MAVLVYPAMQNWWKVRRDIQLLQTESDAVIQRNNEIQSKIDDLETPEGIESRAREEFGWVYPGEDAVNINGLGSHNSSTALPDSIPPGSLRPDIDWVTETLDFIFGYEYPSTPPASDDVIIGL